MGFIVIALIFVFFIVLSFIDHNKKTGIILSIIFAILVLFLLTPLIAWRLIFLIFYGA